jgi:vacuolar-type H+-ATPase subunit F/Vma7
MHARFIGDARDGTGFSLAGVPAAECQSRAELVDALESARLDPDVAIIVVAPATAALAPDVIERMRDATRLPITIVLPDGPATPEGAVA